MASFDSNDLGPAVEMRTTALPHALQIITYPGINGTGVNRCGSRGGMTEAIGVNYADTVADLATLENNFRQLQVNATSGTLVDTTGTSWTNVILIEFRPIDTIDFAAGFGYVRSYQMQFYHPT